MLKMERRPLPDERKALTHKFSIAGYEYYLIVGAYEDETLGEVRIVGAKEGSVVSGLLRSLSEMISLALQYGVPLEAIVEQCEHERFEPSGFTKNPDISYTKSIVDYVAHWLRAKFLTEDTKEPASEPTPQEA